MNHAAAFNAAARAELERRERLANPERPRRHAWATAAVARALGVPTTQWHNWTVGRQSPSTARLVDWLRAWESAGLPSLTVTTTAMGVEVDNGSARAWIFLAPCETRDRLANDDQQDAADELAAVLTLLCDLLRSRLNCAAIWTRADVALTRWAVLSAEEEAAGVEVA